MRVLDHDYVEELVERFSSLEPNAAPLWGVMDGPAMIRHLISLVRFSMGRGGTMPDQSNWLSRNVLGPLLINGFLRFPKNVNAPSPLNAPEYPAGCDDLETLHALLEDYLGLVQAGELEPIPHPYFGAIGVDGWAKLHVAHFEHHLKQFQL